MTQPINISTTGADSAPVAQLTANTAVSTTSTLVPALRAADPGVGFNLADFDTVEIVESNESKPRENRLHKLKFDGHTPRILRTSSTMTKLFPHHRVDGDDFHTPVMCPGAGCPFCKKEQKFDPTAQAKVLVLYPVLDLETHACGFLEKAISMRLNEQGQPAASARKGDLFDQLRSILPKTGTVDLMIRKPTQYLFEVKRHFGAEDDQESAEKWAEFTTLLQTLGQAAYSQVIEVYTLDELLEKPSVQRLIKLNS